ncbi:hypothetical protein HN499_04715 [archaeon]|jgi:hypothetical protein|nr:hypothetical protein [archaeon]MBT6956205.1 hypothetical protein [archaeon]
MRNKRAAAGETILTIYRIVLISFIALVILGLSAVFYDYYIDVRDTEAIILTEEVVNCLVPKGVGKLDLKMLEADDSFDKNRILEYCGFDKEDGIGDRLYVKVIVINDAGKEIKTLQDGDSGLGWVKDLLEEGEVTKYRPGSFERDDFFEVIVIDEKGNEINGKLSVEVLVDHEF